MGASTPDLLAQLARLIGDLKISGAPFAEYVVSAALRASKFPKGVRCALKSFWRPRRLDRSSRSLDYQEEHTLTNDYVVKPGGFCPTNLPVAALPAQFQVSS